MSYSGKEASPTEDEATEASEGRRSPSRRETLNVDDMDCLLLQIKLVIVLSIGYIGVPPVVVILPVWEEMFCGKRIAFRLGLW